MTRHELNGAVVEMDAPVEIARGGGHLWFPVFHRLDERRILCEATVAEDRTQGEWPAAFFISDDGGASWSHRADMPCWGPASVPIEPGKLLLQPYELWPLSPGERRGARAEGTLVTCDAAGCPQWTRAPVTYHGFPRDIRMYDNQKETQGQLFVGTGFNMLPLPGGRLLSSIHCKFEGDKRFSLCAVVSDDHGSTWKFLSVVAGAGTAPEPTEGPNEADIVRLDDGRLMCVFRVAMRRPFWMSTSADGGASWSPPVECPDIFSVKPQLLRLPDGTALLSGGREGVFLWVSRDGGQEWQRVDLVAHHNAHVAPALRYPEGYPTGAAPFPVSPTTSYTSLLATGPDEVLLCYDRLANGWKAAPGPYGEENAIFCVRIRVRNAGS